MLHRFGAFEFDERVFELRRSGRRVPLEPRALELLAYFLHHRGRLIRHDELIREVWQGTAVSRSAIAFAVSNLRAALGADAQSEPYVATVHGRGYRFAAGETPAPMPELAAPERAPAPLFVGRSLELRALAQALERAHSGRRCISLLAGEAGIGKTRLAEEHAERSRAQGFGVYVGRCLEDDAAPDYWPWLQLLRSALDGEAPTPHTAPLRRFAQGAEDWSRALGLGDGGTLGAARFRLFDAISQFWMLAARRRPLLLVLEDLHGADSASLSLLQFLARSSRDARIALLGSYRSAHPGPALVELLAALGRDPETRVFELGPLARSEVALLVRNALGDDPRPDFAEAVWQRTEGHPLFVGEMCRGIERDRERLRGAAPDAIAIAGGVRDAIRARVARVSPSCRLRLEAASALGRDVDPRLLLQVDDAPASEHLAALDEAIAERLLEADAGMARLRFCHALVREVIYEAIPLPRRAELHHRAADALSAAPAEHAAELARHLMLAGPLADPLRVAAACVAEARRAASLLAFEAALAHFDQAIGVLAQRAPGELALRCDLLLEQTELAARTGDGARARTCLTGAVALARQLRSPERLTRAVLADPGASARTSPKIIPENDVAVLEEALRGLPATATPMRVELLARLSNLPHWSEDQRRRREAAAQALEMARALGDPRALGRALLARHLVLWTPDHLDERLQVADECLRLARTSDDRELLAFAHQARATVFFEQADAEQFRHEIDAMRRLLERTPGPLFGYYRCWLAVVDGSRAFMGGRFDEAERLAREAARLEGVDAAEARRWTGLLMFSIRREQGRLAELDPLLPLITAQDAPVHAWGASLVLLHAAAGRREQAREGLALLSSGRWRARRDATWLPTLAMLAQVTALGRDRERAEALLAELEPYADRILVLAQGVGSFGTVARHLGLLNLALDRSAAAVRHFESALEIAERWDAELWLAVGRCELASALLAQGKRARARTLHAEGVASARRLGLAPLAWWIEQASEPPRRPPPPNGRGAVTLIKS
jgi:DNA-binding winged helix-turn-helix (wHTH) protein/tetratricopeptide (TPR) repeat protein